jgi:hypothetical protein
LNWIRWGLGGQSTKNNERVEEGKEKGKEQKNWGEEEDKKQFQFFNRQKWLTTV